MNKWLPLVHALPPMATFQDINYMKLLHRWGLKTYNEVSAVVPLKVSPGITCSLLWFRKLKTDQKNTKVKTRTEKNSIKHAPLGGEWQDVDEQDRKVYHGCSAAWRWLLSQKRMMFAQPEKITPPADLKMFTKKRISSRWLGSWHAATCCRHDDLLSKGNSWGPIKIMFLSLQTPVLPAGECQLVCIYFPLYNQKMMKEKQGINGYCWKPFWMQ